MESKDYDLVKEEIALVISELNSKEILSRQDKIEIEDHFYCDVEELVNTGLTAKEALLVTRSRFGELEGIREEYEVLKPESNILYFSFVGVLMFSCFKGLLISTNIIAQIFWICTSAYDSTFLKHNFWADIPVRFLLLIAGGWSITKLFKRKEVNSFSSFWYVPLLYLSLEIINRLIGYFVLPGVNTYTPNYNMQFYGVMLQNQAIVSIITIILIGLAVSFYLFQLKKNEHRYV